MPPLEGKEENIPESTSDMPPLIGLDEDTQSRPLDESTPAKPQESPREDISSLGQSHASPEGSQDDLGETPAYDSSPDRPLVDAIRSRPLDGDSEGKPKITKSPDIHVAVVPRKPMHAAQAADSTPRKVSTVPEEECLHEKVCCCCLQQFCVFCGDFAHGASHSVEHTSVGVTVCIVNSVSFSIPQEEQQSGDQGSPKPLNTTPESNDPLEKKGIGAGDGDASSLPSPPSPTRVVHDPAAVSSKTEAFFDSLPTAQHHEAGDNTAFPAPPITEPHPLPSDPQVPEISRDSETSPVVSPKRPIVTTGPNEPMVRTLFPRKDPDPDTSAGTHLVIEMDHEVGRVAEETKFKKGSDEVFPETLEDVSEENDDLTRAETEIQDRTPTINDVLSDGAEGFETCSENEGDASEVGEENIAENSPSNDIIPHADATAESKMKSEVVIGASTDTEDKEKEKREEVMLPGPMDFAETKSSIQHEEPDLSGEMPDAETYVSRGESETADKSTILVMQETTTDHDARIDNEESALDDTLETTLTAERGNSSLEVHTGQ